jgi:branched-chain amino acid transport system substrate-binding protein
MLIALVVTATAAGLVPTGNAHAQGSAETGVTDKEVKIGYISSESGAAGGGTAKKGCQARVDAQNAKGGVNGRILDVEYVNDQSSGANLTAAQDLVKNRGAFAVVDNSALAFLAWRYLKEAGVPMIGAGYDGSYYYEKGNESIISPLGTNSPVPGLVYDASSRVMKQFGATKIAAVGYGISPSSSENAKATETFGAKSQGLKGVYLNNTLEFGSTDVGAVVLGIKNSGADAVYLPLGADANFAIVQGLQQNNVDVKVNVLGTGYSQALLDQPIVKTIKPSDVMFSSYRPVELGGAAVKKLQANLKKYGGVTGVPDYGTYTGYVACALMIHGLENAGKNPTRQGFVDGIRKGGTWDAEGLMCSPLDFSYESFGKVKKTTCTWFLAVKDGKFTVLNRGKPYVGKLVGDSDLLAQYVDNNGGVSATTTTAAPSP